MRKFSMWLIVLVLLAVMGCGSQNGSQSGSSSVEGEKEFAGVELKAVSFVATNHPLMVTVKDWIEVIEQATDGKVKVQLIGGPEAIPEAEQINALMNGVIDVNFNVTANYKDQAPAAEAVTLSQLKPWEERENGFYDKLVEVNEQVGIRYIGRWLSNELPSRLWINRKVSTLDDLRGLRIRSHPLYNGIPEAFGMVPTVITSGDVYTALQQGIVDGFFFGTLIGPRQNGWTDTTKFIVDHPFFNQNGVILMRQDVWQKIPAEYQEKIIEATAEYEHDMDAYFANASQEERVELEKIGVQFLYFPEDQARMFVDKAYEIKWNALSQSLSADELEELRSLTQKQ